MSNLTLKVDSQIYGGWKSIKIQRGMRRFAGTFELELTDKWANSKTKRVVKEDSPCVIEIDGETIITGYTDDVLTNYDDKSHSLTVNGRSKTGDLVDCSANKFDYPNMDLAAIAKKECAVFGIKVVVECDVGEPFKNASRDVAETYHEFLAKLATYRAVHLTSNAQGDLVIARASKEKISTALILGENILTGSGKRSKRDRFHTYTVTGQQAGDDFINGNAAAHIDGVAIDKNIRKERTLYIVPDDLTLNDAKRIAENDRNIRFGESQPVTYTVNGWRHSDGLWQPNKLVHVVDPYNELKKDLLIVHVTFTMDEDGQRTELQLLPPEALDLIPLPEEANEDSFL